MPRFAPVFLAFGLLLAAGCDREPEPAATAWQVAMDMRFRFSPATFRCVPGQALVIRVTNTVPVRESELPHTFALLQAGVDPEEFGREATSASAADGYIPAQFRSRVLAHTRLLRPGETEELALVAPLQPGRYPVVCTFPGHCGLGMRGELIVR